MKWRRAKDFSKVKDEDWMKWTASDADSIRIWSGNRVLVRDLLHDRWVSCKITHIEKPEDFK